MTHQRIDVQRLAPGVSRAMAGLQQSVTQEAEKVGLEPAIVELIKIRSSQINKCAFCLNMHTADARRVGISDQRIDVLTAWREADLYSERERAALALAEAITLLPDDVPDDVWQEAAKVFSEEQLAVVVWSAAVINTWNRLAVTSRAPVSPR